MRSELALKRGLRFNRKSQAGSARSLPSSQTFRVWSGVVTARRQALSICVVAFGRRRPARRGRDVAHGGGGRSQNRLAHPEIPGHESVWAPELPTSHRRSARLTPRRSPRGLRLPWRSSSAPRARPKAFPHVSGDQPALRGRRHTCHSSLVAIPGSERLLFVVEPRELRAGEVTIGLGTTIEHEIARRLHSARVSTIEIDRAASIRDLSRFCEDVAAYRGSEGLQRWPRRWPTMGWIESC